MNQQYDSPPLMSGKTMAHHGEEQHPPLPQIMHAAGLQGSAFSFTENELKVKVIKLTEWQHQQSTVLGGISITHI